MLKVHDGDTVTVAPCGDADTPLSVRLYGIDAPELDQPYGEKSKSFLQKKLPAGEKVEVIPMGMDRYGRVVALIGHAGKIINGGMIQSGMAWVYERYCKAKFCKGWKKTQKKARASSLGLWSDKDATPPWQWRKR